VRSDFSFNLQSGGVSLIHETGSGSPHRGEIRQTDERVDGERKISWPPGTSAEAPRSQNRGRSHRSGNRQTGGGNGGRKTPKSKIKKLFF